jgi:hypothetical protein
VLVGKQNFWLLNYHAKSNFQFKGITAKKQASQITVKKEQKTRKGNFSLLPDCSIFSSAIMRSI